jgi:hypothetical protein
MAKAVVVTQKTDTNTNMDKNILNFIICLFLYLLNYQLKISNFALAHKSLPFCG